MDGVLGVFLVFKDVVFQDADGRAVPVKMISRTEASSSVSDIENPARFPSCSIEAR